MGACFISFYVFEIRPTTAGQTETSKNIISNLLLFDDREIDKYYTVWMQMDLANSGRVNIGTLVQFLGIKSSQDSKSFRRILNFFDAPGSRNEFNFLEWILSFWNMMTLSDIHYPSFSFLLAEQLHGTAGEKSKRELATTSLLQTLCDLEGAPFEKGNPEYKRIKDLFPSHISEADWLRHCKDNTLFRNLPRIIGELRKTIIGEKYWKDEVYRRKHEGNLGNPRLLSTLISLVEDDKKEVLGLSTSAAEQEFLNSRSQIKAAPHKRRESKILTALKLHPNQKLNNRVGASFGGADIESLQEEVRETYKKELKSAAPPGQTTRLRKKSVVEIVSESLIGRRMGHSSSSAAGGSSKELGSAKGAGRRKSVIDTIRDSVTRKKKT